MLTLPFSIIHHEKCQLGRLHHNIYISLAMNDPRIFECELQHFSP